MILESFKQFTYRASGGRSEQADDWDEDHDNTKYPPLDEEQKKFLDVCVDGKWETNDLGSVNVTGNFQLKEQYQLIRKIPLNLHYVSGDFELYQCNQLTSLWGCPKVVMKIVSISGNRIMKDLEFFPKNVGGGIYLDNLAIRSLKGIPGCINDDLEITHSNMLTSLDDMKSMFTHLNAARVIQKCREVPEHQVELFRNVKLYELWMVSPIQSMEEFIRRNRGKIKGERFGL